MIPGSVPFNQTYRQHRLAHTYKQYLVDTGSKLNAHKMFRRRPGRLLNVLCTFSLLPVPTGKAVVVIWC